jgi:hypothetical protein
MCFGTIVAKMWRIYFIFYHPRVKITNRKQMVYSLLIFYNNIQAIFMSCLQIVKDWHLTMIVVALCLIVVIICVSVAIWARYESEQVPDIERPESRNVSFNYSFV